MTARRRQQVEDTDARLREATSVSEAVSAQGEKVTRQLSLVERLSEGWRRVHATNHLAELFKEDGHLG